MSQEKHYKFLSSLLQGRKQFPALLFLGSGKDEKQDFAKKINLYMNCQQKADANSLSFCGTCMNCKWILADEHPASPLLLAAEAESKKAIIKIKQIEDLQKELAKSCEYFRVVIVPDASYHCLSKHSANALLKTLEEPPARTLFVLFASEKETVLNTISSRCLELHFASNDVENTTEETKELYAKYAHEFDALEQKSKLKLFDLANELSQEDSRELSLMLREIANDYQKKMIEDASCAQKIIRIEELISDLRAFVRPRLALEEALFELSARN